MARAGRRRGRARGDGRPSTGSSLPVPLPASPAVHGCGDGPRRLGRVSLAALDCRAMIYVCVPAHNEAHTIGLVLWKVRQDLTAFPHALPLLLADYRSDDATASR